MGNSVLEEFRRQLFRSSISENRLGRLAVMTLLEGEFSDASKDSIVRLFQDYGWSEEDSRKRLDEILESLSKIEIRPGPLTFGG